MIAPYTDEPARVLTPQDIIDLKHIFIAQIQDGQIDDARHLMDSVRVTNPNLADELYRMAQHVYKVILD